MENTNVPLSWQGSPDVRVNSNRKEHFPRGLSFCSAWLCSLLLSFWMNNNSDALSDVLSVLKCDTPAVHGWLEVVYKRWRPTETSFKHFSTDKQMSFGMDKGVTLVIRKGKAAHSAGSNIGCDNTNIVSIDRRTRLCRRDILIVIIY